VPQFCAGLDLAGVESRRLPVLILKFSSVSYASCGLYEVGNDTAIRLETVIFRWCLDPNANG
jgi:hypothetical protein